MKYVSTLLIIGFFSCCGSFFAQDLQEAVRHHFLDEHFTYDPALIQREQIASIDEVYYEYKYRHDSLGRFFQSYNKEKESVDVLEKMLPQLPDSTFIRLVTKRTFFQEDGRPLRIEQLKTFRSDSAITEFHYDTLGNLIGKTVTRPSNYHPRNNRETEIFRWEYSGKTLIGAYHYTTKDDDSREHLALFSADSIAYDPVHATVTLFSGKENSEKKGFIFHHPAETVLTFYPDHKLKSRTIRRENYTETKTYDPCGYDNRKLPDLIAGLTGYDACLSPEWSRLRIDRVVKTDSLTAIYLRNFGDLFGTGGRSIFFSDLDSVSVIRIYPKERRLTVQTVGEHEVIKQAGNEHWHTHEIRHYDFGMRLLLTERFRSMYWAGIDMQYIHMSETPEDSRHRTHSPEYYEAERYEYYENGIVKCISYPAGLSKTVFKLSYF